VYAGISSVVFSSLPFWFLYSDVYVWCYASIRVVKHRALNTSISKCKFSSQKRFKNACHFSIIHTCLFAQLTLWRRNFLLNFSTPVFKLWIIQEPKKIALWNKRHFEEKKLRLCSMFKIFSMYICWILNI